MEFVNWTILASNAGSLAMVLVITQVTKNIKGINKIPTQLWSYLIALVVLYLAYYFTKQLTVSNAVLILFNGMIVALAANGGFAIIKKLVPSLFSSEDEK